ncbi:MAG: hypothetical protein ABW164_01430 [Sphingobium sp.]
MKRRLSTITLPALLLAPACEPAPVASAPAEAVSNRHAPPPLTGNKIAPAPPRPAKTNAALRTRSPAQVPDLAPLSDDDGPVEIFPAEVTAFMVDRDRCDHFRGEKARDAERRAFLQASIGQLCVGSDARLAALRARHATEPTVIAALEGYDDRIEEPVARRDLFDLLPSDLQ